MQHLRDQLARLHNKVFKLKDPQVKRDLHKIVINVEVMLNELSREAVECRRLNSLQRTNTATAKFLSLSKEIDDCIYRLEKYLTMYSLLG